MSQTLSYKNVRDLLTGMSYKRGNTGVASRTYTYDAAGRPITRNTARNGTTVNDSFGYNNRSELTAATVNSGAYSYNYDNIGNRNTAQEITEEITNYTANNLNQYTAIGDFAPTYDAAGNQTLVKTTTGIWTVAYDAENRPVSFTNAETNTVIEASCSTDGKPKVNLIHVAIYPPFDKESTVLSYRQTPSSSPHSVEVSIPINLYYTQTSLIGNITGYGGIGAGLVSFKINNIWTTLGSFLISLIGFYSTSEEKYIFHHYHKFTVNCKCAPTRVWIRGTERYIEEERWNAFVEDRTIEA